ncbi:hypothetical protein TRFO_04014 [Tritrichomonas foetus]|uniref:Cilium assembly protein DZIP1 N-terminal domain-containing protein n=1 Tax=Tritrichomonas foetus TaxID=1144522 RepID=A0A1J4KI69_9EUKA|nr:hypothetical protein TRFO_04014 [Tritrichomonas foetus]|eukprot:OHT11079.1 hypothetical protein TRFO_04014 [Tritrichomonas foetus]
MFAPHPGASSQPSASSQPYCSAPNPFNCNYFSPDLQPQPEFEYEQEQGYMPPDPALYNFYSPEQQFMQPQQPRYTFLRRINKMNWDLLANVDVGTIARNGDTASVEYLMQPLAFANITQEDMQQFGSRSALHAFLILQMAVELLMGKLNAAVPPPQQQQAQAQQVNPQQIAQYEARINLLNKDIKARDMIISNLSDKLKFAEQARDEAYSQLQTNIKHPMKIAAAKMSNVNSDYMIPTKEKVKMSTIPGNNETGALHLDTEYFEYLQNKPIDHQRKKPHHHHHQHSSSSSSSSRHGENANNNRPHKNRKEVGDVKRKKKIDWNS